MWKDDHFNWRCGRIFVPAKDFMGIIGTSGADTGQSGGNPVVAVASGNAEIGVVQIAAANDEVAHYMAIPWDLDRDAEVLARLHFIHAATDADTPSFTVKSTFYGAQDQLGNFDTSPDCTGTISSHACSTTDDSLELTEWVTLNWENKLTEDDSVVGFTVACTNLGGASANEIELVGIEILYQIRAMDDVRRESYYERLRQPN